MTDKLPTDTEMLDFLQANGEEGCWWVYRRPTKWRGVKIYATLTTPHVAYPTIREAIAARMTKEKGE